MLVVCVGHELRAWMISRGICFLSGEPGRCQLGGSVTDFTEETEEKTVFETVVEKKQKLEQ